jgi:LEA14-like dessication related protein
MKGKLIFILMGIAVLATAGYFAVKSWIDKIDFGVKSSEIKLLALNFQQIQLRVPMWVYNPTPFNIIIKKFDINVYIDDVFIAKMVSDNNYMIKTHVASEYPIIVVASTPQVLDILKERGTIIDEPNWMEKVNIRIDGTVSIESGVVNVNRLKVNFDDKLKNWMM